MDGFWRMVLRNGPDIGLEQNDERNRISLKRTEQSNDRNGSSQKEAERVEKERSSSG